MSSPVLSSGIGPGLGGLEDELDSSRNLGQFFIKPKYCMSVCRQHNWDIGYENLG